MAVVSALLLLVYSCSKNDETEILSYAILNQTAEVEISSSKSTVNITFPENVTDAGNFIPEFTLSDGAVAYVNNEIQKSGQSEHSFENPFLFIVEAENGKNVAEWTISGTNNSYTLLWGLGGILKESYSNNRDYEWYLDQANTGTYSSVNCGPTSTTMIAKWSLPSFSKTPEDARAAYRPEGGWWYTSDINNYLADNSIPHGYIALSTTAYGTEQVITEALEEGYNLILCVDMYYVRNELNSNQRVDKFYTASTIGWGHFIVVKGYRRVGSQLYLEIYDPNSYSRKYSDNSLKGKDRYYRGEDIFLATNNWWNYAIAVSESGAKTADIKGLDPATVPSMWGR